MENERSNNFDNRIVEVKKDKNNSFNIEKLGKVSLQVGEKLGKAVTEWFTGKPLTEAEKKRRERLKLLKEVQEESQFQRDLEAAKRGEYVPPAPKEKPKKKDDALDMFKNLGKHNPLEGFNNTNSIGNKNFGVESYGGVGAKEIKMEDLELPTYSNNPLGKRERRYNG